MCDSSMSHDSILGDNPNLSHEHVSHLDWLPPYSNGGGQGCTGCVLNCGPLSLPCDFIHQHGEYNDIQVAKHSIHELWRVGFTMVLPKSFDKSGTRSICMIISHSCLQLYIDVQSKVTSNHWAIAIARTKIRFLTSKLH